MVAPLAVWGAETKSCANLVSEYQVKMGWEQQDRHKQFFRYQDLDHKFIFEASLSDDGQVTLEVFLKNSEKKIRSRFPGRLLYDEMIRHFRLSNIQSIVGVWVSGDNYQAYHAARERGLSPEAAAFETWSGQRAYFYGFKQAQVFENILDITKDGRPSVEVVFSRPQRKRGPR